MPLPGTRRKRALATDSTEGAEVLRTLLATRKVSKATLSDIIRGIRDNPDVVRTSIGAIEAAADVLFESVRRSDQVAMQD